MTDCLFCKIIADEIPAERLYEDERVIVIRDINPKADVHLLLIPKEHIASLDDLTAEHDAVMAHCMRLLPRLAQDQGLDEGFRTIVNTGKGAGQEIPHLHLHILGGENLPGF